MDTTKIIVAIMLVAAFFIFLPQLLSFAFSGFGTYGSGGTLSEPQNGRLGVLAISFNGGNSFEEARVHDLAAPDVFTIEKVGSMYFAGSDKGLLVSKDAGLNWYPFSDLEKQIDAGTVIYDFAVGPNNTIYISAYKNDNGVIYVTKDNFFSVTPIWAEGKIIVPTVVSDQGYLYMGLSDGRLLRYSFSQGSFQKVNTFSYRIRDLAFVSAGPSRPRNLFVGLESGRIYTDSGTRQNFSELRPLTGRFISSQGGLHITNDPQNQPTVYLASISGIFRSANQGSDWREINSILPERARITSLAVQNNRIFATADAKLYISFDGGATWVIKEPLPTERRLGALFVGEGGNVVVVGTSK